MNKIEVGLKQLDHLTMVCDNADELLRKINGASENPEDLQLSNAKLGLVVTECRHAIRSLEEVLRGIAAGSEGQSARFQAHRGMLEKIVRMKVAARGRNLEAAMAAESFLAQNPAA
jgi:ElaB/YqjD/DUF883 family membrane-anchored ribosome-binding protein